MGIRRAARIEIRDRSIQLVRWSPRSVRDPSFQSSSSGPPWNALKRQPTIPVLFPVPDALCPTRSFGRISCPRRSYYSTRHISELGHESERPRIRRNTVRKCSCLCECLWRRPLKSARLKPTQFPNLTFLRCLRDVERPGTKRSDGAKFKRWCVRTTGPVNVGHPEPDRVVLHFQYLAIAEYCRCRTSPLSAHREHYPKRLAEAPDDLHGLLNLLYSDRTPSRRLLRLVHSDCRRSGQLCLVVTTAPLNQHA